ncbi:hypothetical protein [Fodinibius halophilus]|uniref:DUF1440 domain-containing protein n=1 Tax=Fodinibius halophilus TaxID=1736908 RepID=A0A6M1T9N9_9BACT|nr:hypothetical protein [Fodinibius halophilus]NGP88751.1 hypothetical protein [Fodinibius halophilus]
MSEYNIRKGLKVAGAGFIASLAMFLLIFLGINVLEFAPFNVPPSAAFLYNLGVENQIYALLLHFAYGMFWSFVLVYTFEEDTTIKKALLLSITLWVFMMLVYSPLIGWGIFGFGYAQSLAPDHPLFLKGTASYIIITLLVHLVYGYILGFLDSRWIGKK